jgi:hypothetical protein
MSFASGSWKENVHVSFYYGKKSTIHLITFRYHVWKELCLLFSQSRAFYSNPLERLVSVL